MAKSTKRAAFFISTKALAAHEFHQRPKNAALLPLGQTTPSLITLTKDGGEHFSSGKFQACKGLPSSRQCKRLVYRSARSAVRPPSSGAGGPPFRPAP